jgi:peptide/nickel transport system substrate-binding protein
MSNDYFETLKPIPGGIYNEGVLGTFTTANPIYASSDVDTTLSSLVFAGLFKYDNNNQLVGDLASSYAVNSKGDTYTVTLKPNLTWQDGQALTSKDVAFTMNLIENPDAQSPLFDSWQGINVSTPNTSTIVFKLPDDLASFPRQLTVGILPEHLLASIPPSEMSGANFNTVNPVGAGPFKWESISVTGDTPETAQEQIELIPFNQYVLGKPKLSAFVVHAYSDQSQLVADFKKGNLNGAEGLDQVPSGLASGDQAHSFIFTAGAYVFFKTSEGILANQAARTALVESVNQQQIVSDLGYQTTAVTEPLLKGMLAYGTQYQQPTYNLAAAKQALTSGGWSQSSSGQWTRNGQNLSFTLTIADTPEYRMVADQLIKYWHILGANVNLQTLSTNSFTQDLTTHSYDSILYAIAIGTDPDVFVYWDSSQADIRAAARLNLSEFSNSTADGALEAGRTRIDPTLRIIKYQPFLQAWQQQLPALGLYQPRLLYLTNGPIYGLGDQQINSNSDRLSNVANWEINEGRVLDK